MADTEDLERQQGRKETWQKVFQVVSDCAYRDDRELIKLLEASRDEDGCGPTPN